MKKNKFKQKLKPTMKNRTKEKITEIIKENSRRKKKHLDLRKLIEENEGRGEARTCNLQIRRPTR